MSTSNIVANEVSDRYNSLTSLKEVHASLLKRYKDSEPNEALIDEVEVFVRRASATGAVLDDDNDRVSAQSLIDYWVTILYRAKRIPTDATLIEFDESLLPELSDSLCPYRGLNAFQEEDKDIFFGRQRLLGLLLDKIKTTQVVFVVGPSGSGKSSLVLAGLVPALKNNLIPGSAEWQYIPPMVPGANPLRNLALALNKVYRQPAEWVSQQVEQMKKDPEHLAKLVAGLDDRPTLVVVDQFEEVFTLCLDDPMREAFIDNILSLTNSANPRHQIILTLRSDCLTYLAHNAALMSFFEQGQLPVMPLTTAELRNAIEEPAKRIDLRFEEGVVEALVKDILGEPEGLPLLQFTLLRLWKTRENRRNRITLKDYRKLGGARRALALTADEFYRSLNEADRITLKRIMLRLALPSGNAEVMRNTVKREALYFEDPRRVNDVLDKLHDAGLVRVTPGDERKNDKIEVAHEALVRHWPTLVEWIEKERVSMRQRLRLTSAAQQWLEHGKDAGGLLGGSLLAEALRYDALNDLEKEFVRASQEAINRAEQDKETARQIKVRRLAQFATVLVVLLILTVSAAAFGLLQAKRARENEKLAKERATLAETRRQEASEATKIAEAERKEATLQRDYAKEQTERLEVAVKKATIAELLAKKEGEKAKLQARRAIAAQKEATKYLRLYEGELKEQRDALELQNERAEADASLKLERLDAAIELYKNLLNKYQSSNDPKGQGETLSQLSRAHHKLADKAKRRQDKTAERTLRERAENEYQEALKILESESQSQMAAAADDSSKIFSILWNKGQFFREHAKYDDAEAVFEKALEIQQKALTRNDALAEDNYDDLVDSLVEIYQNHQNDIGKLENLYVTALNKKRELHAGTEDTVIYKRLTDLATFYRQQVPDSLQKVLALNLEALGILEQVIKNDPSIDKEQIAVDYLKTLTEVANSYVELGEDAKAEEFYREVLARQKQNASLETPGNDMSHVEASLAQLLKKQEKYPEALTAYGEVLKSNATRGDVRNLIINLEAAAEIYHKQKQPEKVVDLYRDTMDSLPQNVQETKNSIASSLLSQASKLYKDASKLTLDEAGRYFQAAQPLTELAYSISPDTPNSASASFVSTLNGFTEQAFAGGANAKSISELEKLYMGLLMARKDVSRPEDYRAPSSLEPLIKGLDKIYRDQYDTQALINLYQLSLPLRTKAQKGTDNPTVYGNYNELGKLYLQSGKLAEAEENYRSALEIVERVFKKEDANYVVDSLVNLAAVYAADPKKYGEAEKLYLRARANLERSTRAKSAKMAEVLEAHATLLKSMGRLDEANKLMETAQQMRVKPVLAK